MINKIIALSVTAMFVIQMCILLVPLYAASCTADCPGGGSVTCTGHGCAAEDGDGCVAWNEDGQLFSRGSCVNSDPEQN